VPQPEKAVVPLPASSPSAIPAPTVPPPSPPPLEQLFVVVQAAPDRQPAVALGVRGDHILLVNRGGTVRNEARYGYVSPARFTNAATIVQAQVQVAAGAAYYVDGDGVVWRLTASGPAMKAADFGKPGDQHVTNFAVSPDGQHLLATVMTFGKPVDCGAGICTPFTEGPSYNYVLRADLGGPTIEVSKTTIDPNAEGARILVVLGWDDVGPFGATDTALATQYPPPTGWNAHPGHIGPAGTVTDSLGGPDCTAQQVGAGGHVLCTITGFESTDDVVRTAEGKTTWTLPPMLEPRQGMAVSPDGEQVAFLGLHEGSNPSAVYRHRNNPIQFRGDFLPLAWADNTTVVGYSAAPEKGVLALFGTTMQKLTLFPIPGYYGGVVNP
jgi:hypothetical protein